MVMIVYSWLLTLIALSVLPIQIGLTLLGAPLFRRQYRAAAEENAKTQSHLVEVLTGIQTVKAQNVEMVSRWRWQEFYSNYIARTFEKTITGTALNQTSSVLQKISQLMVLMDWCISCSEWRLNPRPIDCFPDYFWICHPALTKAVHNLAKHSRVKS